MESYENNGTGNISHEGILKNAEGLLKELDNKPQKQNFFMTKTCNEWITLAKARPMPLMLFDTFWSQDELCVLFAESGIGKSLLAVQIADSISTGRNIPGFRLEARKQKVLYFDFELTEKMFEKRYSQEFDNHYQFDDNLIRVEINPDAEIPEGMPFEEYLNLCLEQTILDTGARVLIIDNITFLRSGLEKAKDALPLMKELKLLKKRHSLSILCLAHTPKRDASKPITRNDLQGSKMLYNFIDSAFAIGESCQDKSLRYVKQIKPRNTELLYGMDNVCVCELIKPSNFLRFDFREYGNEMDHLIVGEADKTELMEKIKGLAAEGKSQRQIAIELNISPTTVNKYLNK